MILAPRRPFVPKNYQRLAVQFLLEHPRAMLAADMGLGKTSTVLSLLELLKWGGSAFFPVLVIAPKRVADVVWTGEQEKWDLFEGLRVVRVLGSPEQRKTVLRSAPIADIYVINYDNIQWLIELFGDKWPFKIVIADESTRLKNFRLNQGGKRAKALAHITKHTGRWINLTGTPAPNGLKDLWGQFWFIDFGERLGRTYTSYMQHWFWENQYTREVRIQPGADKEIHAALADVMISLRAEDWIDIDKPLRTAVQVELPPDVRKLYDKMEDEFYAEFGGVGIEAQSAAAKSSKLLQMASGSVYDDQHIAHWVHDAKIEALHSIRSELQEPLLVVYHWQFDPPQIRKAFPHARIYETEKDRDDWNAGKIDMLLIHPKSAGHGVDLQDGGRAVAFYTHTWDLELRQQVIERIGPARQWQAGHNRAVLVYDIEARNTMDRVALDRVDSKCTVQEALSEARRLRTTGDLNT